MKRGGCAAMLQVTRGRGFCRAVLRAQVPPDVPDDEIRVTRNPDPLRTAAFERRPNRQRERRFKSSEARTDAMNRFFRARNVLCPQLTLHRASSATPAAH
jgi:hypothetical protein